MPYPRPALFIAGLAFLVSGASALVYQVAWQRILALHTGVGIYSIAMIVAAFMAGLGFGSLWGGRLSTRLQPREALRAFGLLEAGIAVFGAASCFLYYDLLYGRAAWLYASPLRAGVLHFLALLVPTGLMGMSLPLLVRALVVEASAAGRVVGLLYGINTLGASLGAFLAPWVLVRFLGIRGAVLCAAGGNLIAAACAFLLASTRSSSLSDSTPEPVAPSPSVAPASNEAVPGFRVWVALYALSGFCALSLEILWFRLTDVAVKSSAFTFGTVLGIYLLGLALGAEAGALRVHRVRDPLVAFVRLQCAVLVWAGLGAFLIAHLPVETPVYEWLFGYWKGAEGFRLGTDRDLVAVAYLYVAFPLLLYGVPTFLMGYSFPVLQRAVQDDPATSGRKVGILQAANIAGCVAGTLVTGLLLLQWIGTPGALRVVIACGLLFVGALARRHGHRLSAAVLAAALALAFVAVPGETPLWLRLHGREGGKALVAEDATSVVAITPTDVGLWFLYVNGKSNSALPYGVEEHTQLGAVPAIIHPNPRDIAIIGLGSGNTAWAAACRAETERVRVFEIAAPQLELLAAFDRSPGSPKLHRFLADPRLSIEVADGRNALEREETLYDLIEADALRPWTGYSGNLYSEEFFARCARRLKPGGVMCTWAPTPRVRRTFARVFPGALEVGAILVGSKDALPLDHEAWAERLEAPAVIDHLGPLAVRKLAQVLRGARRAGVPARGLDANHDLRPRDEFANPEPTAKAP